MTAWPTDVHIWDTLEERILICGGSFLNSNTAAPPKFLTTVNSLQDRDQNDFLNPLELFSA